MMSPVSVLRVSVSLSFVVASLAGCGGTPDQPEVVENPATTGDETAQTDPIGDPCGEGGEGCEDSAGEADATDSNGSTNATDGPDATEGTDTTDGSDASSDAQPTWQEMIALGRQAYAQACGSCHPNGNESIGPPIRRIGWSVQAMTRQIRVGSGRMRGISAAQLPDEYMDDIMAYMSTLGAVVGVQRPDA